MIKVFFLEPTTLCRLVLRRSEYSECPGNDHGTTHHSASVPIGVGPRGTISGDVHNHEDPRWPKACACGYVFKEEDSWTLLADLIYKRADTGEEMILRDAPPGAVWNAWWMTQRKMRPAFNIGEDDRCLMVRTPGGDWCIDARASNCTMPEDTSHKCWVRHGKPEDGTLHVDKNGHTCAAGAGSISLPNYHGFLHHGHLVSC